MRERMDESRGPASVMGQFSYLKENVGDFYLTISVGNPPQHVILTLDTGSELTWIQCKPCKVCSTSGGPSFSFNNSASYMPIPCVSPLCTQSLGFSSGCSNSSGMCVFQLQYGDGSVDAGYISVDAFHLNGRTSKPIVFGCATIDIDTVPVPTSGIMGLNAGPFSFPSQIFSAGSDVSKKFAYCLPDRYRNLNKGGTILFGEYNITGANFSYTPLVPPYGPVGDLYYFVDMQGISVGDHYMEVKAHMKSESMEVGGTIFDSGTAVTHLMKNLHEKLVSEIRRQTMNLSPFAMNGSASDVCYRVPMNTTELPKLPLVTMHFQSGVDLELGPESLLYPTGYDAQGIVLCLAFISSQSGIPFNIIGNYQQQNYWVEYNLQSSRLGLVKASC
ncbi:hypothetical protein KP509_13G057900 [Ceratopteris richardii]|nr:hypothetical protein KP509_13G057900 [Ceratopteris richardii]